MAGKKIVKVVVCKVFPRRPLQCVTALVIPEKYKHQFSNLKEDEKLSQKKSVEQPVCKEGDPLGNFCEV